MGHYIGEIPYIGEERLVISLDVGTTHTALSYVLLYAGDLPQVTKWPGQPVASGDTKIPTIVAYQQEEAKAFGVEAEEYIDDDEYEIARWFKLHLHPDHIKVSSSEHPPAYGNDANTSTMEVPPLPAIRQFFESSTLNGKCIWNRVQTDKLTIVFAIPNGWTTSQQGFLREAAIESGWVTEENSKSCLTFVTEGEASVHYALSYQSNAYLRKEIQFMVVDAGGSTVDSTLYECQATLPKLTLKEVRASACVQAGGIFVDRALFSLLREKLRTSNYGTEEWTSGIVHQFEKKAKRLFDGSQTTNVIHFGKNQDTDRSCGIVKGRLFLSTSEVSSLFNDVTSQIVRSCRKLLRGHKVAYLILVGGFGESPYLQKRLEAEFSGDMTELIVADEPSKKAAAEGAIIWYLKKLVVARAARFTYGIKISAQFDPYNAAHQVRRYDRFTDVDGQERISNAFSTLIAKDKVVDETYSTSSRYYGLYSYKPVKLDSYSVKILFWSGDGCPNWYTDENGIVLPEMHKLCTVQADLSGLSPFLLQKTGIDGRIYWRIDFNICLEFGGTELKAVLQWKEGEKVCRGPATILPYSTSKLFG